MAYILDTDLLSLLERWGADSLSLQMRLGSLPENEVVLTIVTCEERLRGWLAQIAQANSPERQISAYIFLRRQIDSFQQFRILDYDGRAATEFERLRQARIRIGTMDLKIAAIALANGATLLSRNLGDFGKVPGLTVEDWSA